ncbi:hypothetical protein C1N61_30440 (plasmid) [Priestia aryabhattai]
MEICYYWTDRLGYEKQNKGFNFGSELKFSYDYNNKKLIVEEDDLYIKNFFNVYSDEQISNITAVVGRNGVGKSTFLEEIKSLYVQGGILAKKDKIGKEYNHQKIFVIKNENNFEIVYHKDLLLKQEKYLATYIPKYIPYGYEEDIDQEKDLFVIKEHSYLKRASCIYFSYAFDNSYYAQSTSINSKYFDLSTKGILNDIDYELERKDYSLNTKTAPLNNSILKDARFNVGFLREYYVRENKKRIQLLNDEIGRNFITKHKFYPTKASLNLDYILLRQDNVLNEKTFKNLLRSERGAIYNKLEKEIYNYVDDISNFEYGSDNKLALVQQTYLRRILDSYFKDVDQLFVVNSSSGFINRSRGSIIQRVMLQFSKQLKDQKRKFSRLNLKDDKNNIIWLMNNFRNELTKFLKEGLTKDENGEILIKFFNASELAAMTERYEGFIDYFNEIFLRNNPAVHIKEGTTYLNPRRVYKAQAQGATATNVSIGIVEIDLIPQGLSLLEKFLDNYNSIQGRGDFIKVEWEGLSTGEDALLGMFSRFYALNKEFEDKSSKKNSGERMVILLDEIEHSLHPEWQRRILNNLIEFLPLVFKTVEKIQIILATNVPFIIADIPTSNIIYLEKSEVQTEKGHTQIVDKPSQTFAANIHSLLMSNFFMDTTIGRFSERKIKDIVNYLNDSNTFPEDQKSTSLKVKKQYSQEEIRKTIKIIGEPVIRTKLESLYINKFRKDTEESVAKQFLAGIESDNNIPEDIKLRLRTMINDLGKEQDND